MGRGERSYRDLNEVWSRVGLGLAGALTLGVVVGWVALLGVEGPLAGLAPRQVFSEFLSLGRAHPLVFVFAGHGAATMALAVVPLEARRLARIEKRLLALAAGCVFVWLGGVVWRSRPIIEGALNSATVFPALLFGFGTVLVVGFGVVLFTAGLSPGPVRVRRTPALAYIALLGSFLLGIGLWAILGLPYLAIQDGVIAGAGDRALLATAVVFGFPSVGLGVFVLRFGFATPPLPTPRRLRLP